MTMNEITTKVKNAFAGVELTKWRTWPTWLKIVAPTVSFFILAQFINPVLLLLAGGITYFIVKRKRAGRDGS